MQLASLSDWLCVWTAAAAADTQCSVSAALLRWSSSTDNTNSSCTKCRLLCRVVLRVFNAQGPAAEVELPNRREETADGDGARDQLPKAACSSTALQPEH